MFGDTIAADVRGEELTLTSPTATLTLRRTQPQPDYAPPSGASPSMTRHPVRTR
jgi:hypothetical protein